TPAPTATPTATASATPSATPAPTPPPTPLPSLTPAPTPAATPPLGPWQLVFTDTFDTPETIHQYSGGTPYRWNQYDDGSSDQLRGRYYLADGSMPGDVFMTRPLYSSGGITHVAAPVLVLYPGVSRGQLYGRYEFRLKADSLPG